MRGPVLDIVTDPEYLDVMVPAHATFVHPVKRSGIPLLPMWWKVKAILIRKETPLPGR